jgi:hypothetical protein
MRYKSNNTTNRTVGPAEDARFHKQVPNVSCKNWYFAVPQFDPILRALGLLLPALLLRRCCARYQPCHGANRVTCEVILVARGQFRLVHPTPSSDGLCEARTSGEYGVLSLFMAVSLDANRDLAARQAASGMSSDCFEPRSDQFAGNYAGLKNLVTHPKNTVER